MKEHLGRMVDDNKALIIYGGRDTTIVALWSLTKCRALTSEKLNFGHSMIWDWDWRAQAVEKAFARLEAEFVLTPEENAAPGP